MTILQYFTCISGDDSWVFYLLSGAAIWIFHLVSGYLSIYLVSGAAIWVFHLVSEYPRILPGIWCSFLSIQVFYLVSGAAVPEQSSPDRVPPSSAGQEHIWNKNIIKEIWVFGASCLQFIIYIIFFLFRKTLTQSLINSILYIKEFNGTVIQYKHDKYKGLSVY